MSDTEIMAGTNEVTDTSAQTTSQDKGRVYTEEEFNQHMAGLKASLTKKLLKPYEDLGDVNELRALKSAAEKRAQEEQMKRGEFEKILQDMAQKKDEEIRKRDQVIEQYKVEQPLLQAASEFRSVNPEQVKSLLRGRVRLNTEGEVEVLDDKGTVRYNDAGQTYQVRDLVQEFLSQNPHFVTPTPATTTSQHSVKTNGAQKIDVTKLDMRNPEHRELYRKMRKEQGLR